MKTDPKELLKQNRKAKTIKYIKLYVVPIITVLVFIGIVLFLIIPKVNEIFSQLDTLSENNNTIIQKNEEIDSLNVLNSKFNELNEDLTIVNEIAPTGKTEVVKFRDRITDLMHKNNLAVVSQTLSENNIDLKDANDKKVIGNIVLQEVPFLFEVNGKYTDITKFISDLSIIDDFVIVKEMQLSSQSGGNDDNWLFKISLVKYQFSNSNIDLLEKAYLAVAPNSEISHVIQSYIDARKAAAAATEN